MRSLTTRFALLLIVVIGTASGTARAIPTPILTASFESGLGGWNTWVQNGLPQFTLAPEIPVLGSGGTPNLSVAQISGNSFVGGIWTIVPVPTLQQMQFDGFWRGTGIGVNSSVIMYDFNGANQPINGQPVTGATIYGRTGTVSQPSWGGIMFDTASVSNPTAPPLTPGSNTGQVVLMLRASAGPNAGTIQFDDLWLQLAATNSSWIANHDGMWSAIENWSSGVPNGTGHTANFGNVISQPTTVTADIPIELIQLNLSSVQPYSISGPGPITLRATSGQASVNVGTGSHVIQTPLVFMSNATLNMAGGAQLTTTSPMTAPGVRLTKSGAGDFTCLHVRTATLTLNAGTVTVLPNGTDLGTSKLGALQIAGGLGALPTATLDLNDNDLVVSNTTTSAVASVILSARNGGVWDGQGITSTAARVQPFGATMLGMMSAADFDTLGGGGIFSGQTYAAGDVLIKYTWYGDADFSGYVDFDDYVRIDQGYNLGLTGWINGDYDLNDLIDFDDYVLIDLAFNVQSGTLRRAMEYIDGTDRSLSGMSTPALSKVVEHFAEFGADYGGRFLSAVPEPASTAVGLTLAVASIAGRRRWTHRR